MAGNWSAVVDACEDEKVYELVIESGSTAGLAEVLLKVQKFQHVQSLVINNCRLRADEVSALQELIPQLCEIRLHHNQYAGAPKGLLGGIFLTGTHLQTLKLTSVDLRQTFPQLA